jgi:hypothetical protein
MALQAFQPLQANLQGHAYADGDLNQRQMLQCIRLGDLESKRHTREYP